MNNRGAAMRDHCLHGHLPFPDEIELVRRVPSAEDSLALVETDVPGASGQQVDVPLFQVPEKRMLSDQPF
jgi:hypothetical protein